jgi:hypothetical protein
LFKAFISGPLVAPGEKFPVIFSELGRNGFSITGAG